MPMALSIRPMGEDDLEFAVAQTSREGWDNTTAVFGVCLTHDPAGCFVGESEGQRVGLITTTCYERSAWVGHLIVVPGYRRRGIGTQMIGKLIGKLSAGRRTRITLEVRETNLPAQLFFRDNGFRAVSVLRDYYEDTPEDAYVMPYRFRQAAAAPFQPANRIARLAG